MSPSNSGRGSGASEHNAQLTGTNTPLRDRSQPGGGETIRPAGTRPIDDAEKPRGQRLSAGDRDARRKVDEDEQHR